MEFPETGQQCSQSTCKQLDFLPFTCHHCHLIFCKEHLQAKEHQCTNLQDNFVVEKAKTLTFKCELCETRTPCEMPCVKCKKHVCLAHRHHGCLDPTEEERTKVSEKWLQPKRDFEEAKKMAEIECARNLKKTKNTAMANKIQLMKLKSRSIGQNGIPMSERRYFLIYYPADSKSSEQSKGIFVSIQWTIGKVTDYASELLKIKNTNNVLGINKLRLFDYNSGNEIAKTMDTKLTDLFDSGVLIDGQSIILEYAEDHKIDVTRYK